MPKNLTTLLSIAGSDPTGCAGIQADIRAGISLGLHVATAITAVTSQNSHGIRDLGVVNYKILMKQLNAIFEDVVPDAIKIGMIGSVDNMKIILDFLNKLDKDIPVVVDPVLTATIGGKNLFQNLEIIDLYIKSLFPLVSVITPNIKEFNIFSEYSNSFIKDNTLVLKGGDSPGDVIEDKLIIKENVVRTHSHFRIECVNLHGTGCTFSSLLASFLALGFSIEEAFERASNNIFEIISHSGGYQLGVSSYGPLNINNYKI